MREFLLLSNRPARGSNADTILEHLDALNDMPGFRVREVSLLGNIPALLDLSRFDAIGIHYTLHISDPKNHWLSQKAIDKIAAFKGPKCIWMHDEYRCADDISAKLRYMGIGTIFTVIPEDVASVIYAPERVDGAAVHTILAGYVSPALEQIKAPPFSKRAITIGYRARRPPYWLGRLGQEKITIGLRTKELAAARGIATDISVEEADRVYGDHWLEFLKNCCATLCVESGSSVVDFSGDTEARVEAAVLANSALSFEDVLPLLDGVDGKLVINCISPRIFEMAACRTLIIAHPGEYSGMIEPWVHYVPLEKDFSNFDEVCTVLEDSARCEEITARAYDDLIASRAYVYDNLSQFCGGRIPASSDPVKPLSTLIFFIQRHASMNYLVHNYLALMLQRTVLSSGLRRFLIRTWLSFPPRVQDTLRPMMKVMGR